MKKTLILGLSVLTSLTSLSLVGCEPTELYYRGKVRPVDEVEEMLEDYLESENPEHDFDIDIQFDYD